MTLAVSHETMRGTNVPRRSVNCPGRDTEGVTSMLDEPNPSGLCMCGCGEPTVLARQNTPDGRVKGRPQRYIKGHQRRKSPIEYLVDPETDCWVWQRGQNGVGYGTLFVNGIHGLAHRHFFEKYVGPIPGGAVVHHLCRNCACVNPKHLEALGRAEHGRMHGREHGQAFR